MPTQVENEFQNYRGRDFRSGGRLYQLVEEQAVGLELPIDGAEWREPL